MYTFFYNRSAYRFIDVQPPACFLELDEKFDELITTQGVTLFHPSVRLAENLCRRMADVDFYAENVAQCFAGEDLLSASICASSLLIGHFSACQSVLDATAAVLVALYKLGQTSRGRILSGGEIDFTKGAFRRALQQEQPGLHHRYARFQATADEIERWRDACDIVVGVVSHHERQVIAII